VAETSPGQFIGNVLRDVLDGCGMAPRPRNGTEAVPYTNSWSEEDNSMEKKPGRQIITFDWAIKTVLRDKANFDVWGVS